ncbi:MAG TPA: LysR family transcriptional regulator [Treponema sp.]|nr:LysR family transcriptional regulator [Treponema sp.]
MFIETYIIRQLAAFADYGTLTRVGEELGITQPTISRAMQKLEAELGVQLFDRTKNRITLNENGAFAAAYAKRIMAMQDEMIARTRERAGLQKKFAVGSVAIQPAVCAVAAAKKCYGGIEARYEIDDDESHLIRALTDDAYQMIILLHPFDDSVFVSQKYFSERLSVMLPKTHPLASRTSLALKELAGETFAVYSEVGFWEKVKREKIPGAQFIKLVPHGGADPITAITAASDMPSFISDRTTAFTLPDNRVAIPLSDSEVNVSFYAVCKRENEAVWRELLDEMQKEAE